MSERNTAIEHVRGIAMLGVVGIHTGAYSLANPDVNIHLFALLEICTRFSVPISFLSQPLACSFIISQQRGPLLWSVFPSALPDRANPLPGLVWALYGPSIMADKRLMAMVTTSRPRISHVRIGILSVVFPGNINLVLHSYAPLGAILPKILENPISNLTVILVAQIAFNYYSSYYVEANSDNIIIRLAIQYRMSYLVFHYVFIFLFGAVCPTLQGAFSLY